MSYLTSGHIKYLKKNGQNFFLKIFPIFEKKNIKIILCLPNKDLWPLKKNFFEKKFMLYRQFFFKCFMCPLVRYDTYFKTTWYQMCRCAEYIRTIFMAQMSLLLSYQPIKVAHFAFGHGVCIHNELFTQMNYWYTQYEL